MIGFLIAAGSMTLLVAAVLVQTLRRASTNLVPDGAQDLVIYRDQLTEVDRDLARGVIPADEAGRLRIEVQRRMLDADRAAAAVPSAPRAILTCRLRAVLPAPRPIIATARIRRNWRRRPSPSPRRPAPIQPRWT
jgi:cytochrome c-type biogenesis protein CcmH